MKPILQFVLIATVAAVAGAQQATPAPRHHFDASAFMLADGSTEGSVVLAPSGGESRAVVSHYEANGVSFDDGEAVVTGRMENDVALTTISVTLHNLNIRNAVHADVLIMRINERQRHNDPEAEITFTGSKFVNVTISGQPIDLEMDRESFSKHPTYAAFSRAVAQGERSFAVNVDASAPDAPISDSIVSVVRTSAGSTDPNVPYAVHVNGVGTVYFGEVIVSPGRRHLSMIRVQPDAGDGHNGRLRSNDPVSGPVTSGGGEGNGTPILP